MLTFTERLKRNFFLSLVPLLIILGCTVLTLFLSYITFHILLPLVGGPGTIIIDIVLAFIAVVLGTTLVDPFL